MSKLSIQGGKKVRSKPFTAWPVHDKQEEKAVAQVVKSGNWGGYPMPNKHAKRFAEAFAKHHHCDHGQLVANGTVSLEIALQAMGVEPGAEVIVPAFTFEATASCALFNGCAPVFVDIDPATYSIDPKAIEAAITSKTQAIIPVHLGCRIADMDAIMKIARKHKLRVLEDCAHAHGAMWKGKGVGSMSDGASFSFQSSKLMTAGEGGIVITNDAGVMDGLFALTNCGRQRPGRTREFSCVGHNYRATDIQAAILEVQLKRLKKQHATREKNMAYFEKKIAKIPGLTPLKRDPRITTMAAYQLIFKYDPAPFGGLTRDAFVVALNHEGIPCDGQFYEALYNSPMLRQDPKRYPAWAASSRNYDCPNAWRAAYEESVWMPHQIFLGKKGDVDDVLEAIDKVVANKESLIGFDHPDLKLAALPRNKRAELQVQAK